MRPGVYIFMDLVMHNIGVCAIDDIALSVLTTVIGHQEEKGWVLVDAGWMAMSRDKGVPTHKKNFGYGLVCDLSGAPMEALVFDGANQEHGILKVDAGVSGSDSGSVVDRYPVGTQFRILPNHACATAAAYDKYYVVESDGSVSGTWSRINGY
jgi:D-serine deaminase-like pyridoxal phosphate-dependent protein